MADITITEEQVTRALDAFKDARWCENGDRASMRAALAAAQPAVQAESGQVLTNDEIDAFLERERPFGPSAIPHDGMTDRELIRWAETAVLRKLSQQVVEWQGRYIGRGTRPSTWTRIDPKRGKHCNRPLTACCATNALMA